MGSIDLLNRLRVRAIDLGQRILSLLFGCTSRTAEYRFVLKNLPLGGSVTILDVGCCGSLLPLKLAKKGYKVHGIDTRRYPERHPNLTSIQGDILCTPFPNGFFDVVIAVSTIEHIGLGAYRDPIHENGDVKAVQEIYRILKAGGSFIVTTPFAGEYKLAKWRGGGVERYYDADTIRKLLEGFHVKAQDFFISKSRFNWISVPEEQARCRDVKWHANIGLVLLKKESNIR